MLVKSKDVIIAASYPTLPESINGYETALTIHFKHEDHPPSRIKCHINPRIVAWSFLTTCVQQQYDFSVTITDYKPFQELLNTHMTGIPKQTVECFSFVVLCRGLRIVNCLRNGK